MHDCGLQPGVHRTRKQGSEFGLCSAESDVRSKIITRSSPLIGRRTFHILRALTQLRLGSSCGGLLAERVLVVDDDPLVRFFAEEALTDAGFRPLITEDGMRALELLREHAKSIDILLTDVRMPGGLDGLQLARLARLMWGRTFVSSSPPVISNAAKCLSARISWLSLGRWLI